MHALTCRSTPVEACHGRGDAAFIQEKQPLQVDGGDYLEELPAPLEVRFRVSLLGVE